MLRRNFLKAATAVLAGLGLAKVDVKPPATDQYLIDLSNIRAYPPDPSHSTPSDLKWKNHGVFHLGSKTVVVHWDGDSNITIDGAVRIC